MFAPQKQFWKVKIKLLLLCPFSSMKNRRNNRVFFGNLHFFMDKVAATFVGEINLLKNLKLMMKTEALNTSKLST